MPWRNNGIGIGKISSGSALNVANKVAAWQKAWRSNIWRNNDGRNNISVI